MALEDYTTCFIFGDGPDASIGYVDRGREKELPYDPELRLYAIPDRQMDAVHLAFRWFKRGELSYPELVSHLTALQQDLKPIQPTDMESVN